MSTNIRSMGLRLILVSYLSFISACDNADYNESKGNKLDNLIAMALDRCVREKGPAKLQFLELLESKNPGNAKIVASKGVCIGLVDVYDSSLNKRKNVDKEIKEVLRYFKEAVALDPDNIEYRVNLALVYEDLNKCEDSITILSEIFSDKSMYSDKKYAIYSANLMRCYYMVGETEEGSRVLKEAMQYSDYPSDVGLALMGALYEVGRKNEFKQLEKFYIRDYGVSEKDYLFCRDELFDRNEEDGIECYRQIIQSIK